jgi:hypothetical protein
MPQRRTLVLAPAVVALALGVAAPASAQTPGLIPTVSKIRTNGIGKVKVNMTVKQARKAAGVFMRKSRVGDCTYLDAGPPNTGQGPTLRFHDGRLRFVEVRREGFATKRGVEVGNRVRKVRRLYNGLKPRVDLGGGVELVWKSKRGRLIFTIINGKVTAIAGGRVPEVLQQECV